MEVRNLKIFYIFFIPFDCTKNRKQKVLNVDLGNYKFVPPFPTVSPLPYSFSFSPKLQGEFKTLLTPKSDKCGSIESSEHYQCQCPSYVLTRGAQLGAYILPDRLIRSLRLSDILPYLNNTNRIYFTTCLVHNRPMYFDPSTYLIFTHWTELTSCLPIGGFL